MENKTKLSKVVIIGIAALLGLKVIVLLVLFVLRPMGDSEAAPFVGQELLFNIDENAELTQNENRILRAVFDDLLWDNFPIVGIGTTAGNRINMTLNMHDEEAGETLEEMRRFIAYNLATDERFADMEINLGVFVIETLGPFRLYAVLPHEMGEISFPAVPAARTSVTYEDARLMLYMELEGLVEPEFLGEVEISGYWHWDEYSQLDEPVTAFLFRRNDLTDAISSCGLRFGYWAGKWYSSGVRSITYHDESQDLPTMHLTNITAYGIEYFFSNPTLYSFMYGSTFRIYAREGDYWRNLGTGIGFTAIGFTVPALSITETRPQSWEWNIQGGVLPPGEYKFTKDFHNMNRCGHLEVFVAEQRFAIE